MVFSNVNRVALADAIFEPLWKKADELGAVIYIHPTDPAGLYSIDGMAGQRASVVRWTLDTPRLDTPFEAAPPAHRSPDWLWTIELQGEEAVLTQPVIAMQFRYNTGGEMPSSLQPERRS